MFFDGVSDAPASEDGSDAAPKGVYVIPNATCRLGTIFIGLALAGVAQSNGRETVDVLTSASASYQLKKHATGLDAHTDIADNEASVVDACHDYVEAQLKYFDTSQNADGVREFAARIRSTPGKRDGLYWPIANGEDESPVGPNLALAAVGEQEPRAVPRPYSGYFFRTLPAQGPAAVGGVRDYRVNGHLVSGFALVAWPARYGISGVQTFVINHSGDVFARDFGTNTPHVAPALRTFNPDHNWKEISSADDENKVSR
jgi:hypothetical protein